MWCVKEKKKKITSKLCLCIYVQVNEEKNTACTDGEKTILF